MFGNYHHRIDPKEILRMLTFFLFSSSAMLFSRDFSCALRFFNRVSGTRICSLVATLLKIAKDRVSMACSYERKLAESELQPEVHSRDNYTKLDGMYLIGEKVEAGQQAENAIYP